MLIPHPSCLRKAAASDLDHVRGKRLRRIHFHDLIAFIIELVFNEPEIIVIESTFGTRLSMLARGGENG